MTELGYVRSGKMRFEELVNKYRIEMDVNKFIRTPVTERMVNRAEKRSMGRLELFLISNEDNILFKSMTEQEKDIDDVFSIVSGAPINWGVIYEETKMLTEKEILEKGLSEATIYPAFVAVKLMEVKNKYNLVDEGVILKFEDLASNFMERIMKKRKSKV
ncbi:MAG: nucleotidyltransferase [Candidatus Bathyarchaeia archaeon]|nr:nucleotidyltransferase [Candidatus Bathyarchaeia archaeon]